MEKEHFYCQGSCGGVSETPGLCQAEDCQKEGEELTSCSCESETHKTNTEK